VRGEGWQLRQERHDDAGERKIMTGRIISGSRELTQLDMGLNAARAAAALQSAGVDRGEAIGLILRNDFAFFEASLAARMIGAYPVPVNWHFTAAEAGWIPAEGVGE
jgi:long-chain acyl-CoA synthetase